MQNLGQIRSWRIALPLLLLCAIATGLRVLGVSDATTLAIGANAPDIVGEDLEGKPLRLSDFRGKVVLLAFWGTSCSPCMAEIPKERALRERYQSKPFAIVGVNSDKSR